MGKQDVGVFVSKAFFCITALLLSVSYTV